MDPGDMDPILNISCTDSYLRGYEQDGSWWHGSYYKLISPVQFPIWEAKSRMDPGDMDPILKSPVRIPTWEAMSRMDPGDMDPILNISWTGSETLCMRSWKPEEIRRTPSHS